jgi:hypothetical protein
MKKENKIVKEYEPTRRGFDKLYDEIPELAELARSVVMCCLKPEYQPDPTTQKEENQKRHLESLQEALDWAGFKTLIAFNKKEEVAVKKVSRGFKDPDFIKNLFDKFHNAIYDIPYDPDDAHGLMDECVKVANIMLKYKHIIALKRKKKSFLESISG